MVEIITRAELKALRDLRRAARDPRKSRAEYMRGWRTSDRSQALIRANLERLNNREAARDRARAFTAARHGYAAPPLERDCPPRPSDGCYDSCLDLVAGKGKGDGFHLDHDHVTGAFRGWVCTACNSGGGLIDNPDKLRPMALRACRGGRTSPVGLRPAGDGVPRRGAALPDRGNEPRKNSTFFQKFFGAKRVKNAGETFELGHIRYFGKPVIRGTTR